MARSWTKEQLQAIETEGSSIIVSAGAGSGKTAVLTERVIRKLRSGIHIHELLVLTFTKAAAYEMKERIRSAIRKEESLKEELDYLDGAYITTFDSFALSVVKKYHYLKNITSNVEICESTVLELEKRKILDSIIDRFYEEENQNFLKLVGDFCTKDDREIRDALLMMYHKIEMRCDKEEYFAHYLDRRYAEETLQNHLLSFECLLQEKIAQIAVFLSDLSVFVDGDYDAKLREVLQPLLESTSYDEIVVHLDFRLPNLPRGVEEEAKQFKEAISSTVKEIKELCIYESKEQILASMKSTRPYQEAILSILQELDQKITTLKQERDLYEFNDIAKLAIDLLQEYPEVRKEMRDSFQEILVDEYQDTNDIQETFLSLIANNNLYMVGDIKQSIYRFRNANPYIFKNKYDRFSKLDGGIKIDLNKNFRSRREPLEDINYLFDRWMDDAIGGAAYQESHRMVFGNTTYEAQGANSENHHFEIYAYEREKNSPYTKEEYEIFLIAQDIKEKVASGYLVFDKDQLIQRPITYRDFVILMDRTTQFDLYKKIFEYFEIPLSIEKDEVMTQSNDLKMLRNLLHLILDVKKQDFKGDFRYHFMSVARSFLIQETDPQLFTYFQTKQWRESTLFQKVQKIANDLDQLTCSSLLLRIQNDFDYDQKLIQAGHIEEAMVRMEYLVRLSRNLEKLGYTIEDFITYLDRILEEQFDIKYTLQRQNENSCKIMTIHKSKGLEYHICYYSGLSVSFNLQDMKEKFLYDSTYGIITPFYYEGIAPTIEKLLLKQHYLLEEISEKIRLFYVALTRCKEKMILISSFQENQKTHMDENGVVTRQDRMKYRSFQDMLQSIYSELTPYIKWIPESDIGLSKDYNRTKSKSSLSFSLEEAETFVVNERIFTQEKVEEHHFSKQQRTLLSKEQLESIAFGKKVHQVLEEIDFAHPCLSSWDLEAGLQHKIEKFLRHPFFNENRTILREYEFIDENGTTGVIDLILDGEEDIRLIDYKLKSIQDDAYRKQLLGYQSFLEKKTKKKVYCYLYSLLDERMEEIK